MNKLNDLFWYAVLFLVGFFIALYTAGCVETVYRIYLPIILK